MSNLKPKSYNLKAGYIALVSTIIIGALLLIITVTLALSSLFGRFNIVDSESKERSSALAEACVDAAILKVSQNAAYAPSPSFDFVNQTGGERPTINGDECTIVSVTTDASQKIIKTKAVINKSHTNLRVIINSTDMSVTSWEECLKLTASASAC